MSGIPQRNARIFEVREQARENYESGPTDGAPKFLGPVGIPAYYREQKRRSSGPGGHSDVVERSLIVPTSALVEWTDGDVVKFTVTIRRGDTRTMSGTVRDVERASLPGVGATTRVFLEAT